MGIKEISTARPNLMYDGPYIEMEEMTRTFLNGLIDAINSYLAVFFCTLPLIESEFASKVSKNMS